MTCSYILTTLQWAQSSGSNNNPSVVTDMAQKRYYFHVHKTVNNIVANNYSTKCICSLMIHNWITYKLHDSKVE